MNMYMFIIYTWCKLLHELRAWTYSMSLEPKVKIWDGKMFFPYTYANKTQKFNHKMNVIHVNP
jgi:hypothetical protein